MQLSRQDARRRVEQAVLPLVASRDVTARGDRDVADGVKESQVHVSRAGRVGEAGGIERVGGREVVMAGHSVQRQAEPSRHVGDEAGLADAGRSLDQYRQTIAPRMFEQFDLAAGRLVIRQCVSRDRNFHQLPFQ